MQDTGALWNWHAPENSTNSVCHVAKQQLSSTSLVVAEHGNLTQKVTCFNLQGGYTGGP